MSRISGSGPDPQDSTSPLYEFIDEQPESSYPNNLDSSPSNFTVRQKTPSSITKTQPIVVTITDHGFENGNVVRATKFIVSPIALATGMEQLNNKSFSVQRITTNTFELYDSSGLPIDGRGYTTYADGGEFTLSGNTTLTVNPSNFPPSGLPLFPPV